MAPVEYASDVCIELAINACHAGNIYHESAVIGVCTQDVMLCKAHACVVLATCSWSWR